MKEVLDALKDAIDLESRVSKEWRDKHDSEAVAFRAELLSEIQPFKEFRMSLTWFWRIALAVSGLVWSVIKGWAWLKDHVK